MTSYAWQDFLNESQLTCTWLPCEVEALAITVATKHFSPYLIQSHHKVCMLTDSKPYLQAYKKLCRVEFIRPPNIIYLSVYREPLPGFCKTCIWPHDTTFSFRQPQGSSLLGWDLPSLNLQKTHQDPKIVGQTDAGSSQKTFLPFSRTSKRQHWSKLSTKKFFFSFFALFREKFRFPVKTFLVLQHLAQSFTI